MRKLAIVAVVLVLVAAVLVVGRPFIVTSGIVLIADEDTYTSSQATTSNFGTATTLLVRNFRDGGSSFITEGFVRFSFTSLVNVQTIESALFRIRITACTISAASQFTRDLQGWQLSSDLPDWTESSATWNLFTPRTWGATGVQQISMPATCPTLPYLITFDATAMVRNWVLNAQVNEGIWLVTDDNSALGGPTDQISYTMSSSEGGSPELEVQYTQSGEIPPPGVGEGTNITRNETFLPVVPPFAFAALIFVLVFLVIAIIARKRPGLAVVLGAVGGAIAAGGYLLLGGT